jgi:hypothetical protein
MAGKFPISDMSTSLTVNFFKPAAKDTKVASIQTFMMAATLSPVSLGHIWYNTTLTLTPCSRTVPEKPSNSAGQKKILPFKGLEVRPPHPFNSNPSKMNPIHIFTAHFLTSTFISSSLHIRLLSSSFSLGFPTCLGVYPPYACYVFRPPHRWFYHYRKLPVLNMFFSNSSHPLPVLDPIFSLVLLPPTSSMLLH